MICIYSTDNTNYSNNGDAVLIPISCTLTMTINGAWQLDLEHPYDAEERYKLIQEGAVIRADIKCVGEQSTIRQRFRIYTYNRGVNSVTCIAFPIAMEATFDAPIDNLVLENKTASEAVAQLQALTQKYSIETNVTGTKSTSFANTNINSALASGDDGCFIQVWGGEVVYDNLKFNIRSRIGSDTGYKIQYGHNMTGIDYSKDDSGLSTRVHPISEDGIRLNGTGYVDSPLIDEYPIHHDRYMITPYRLVDTEEASPSRTAQETRACVSAVTTATTTLSQSSYATALGAGYQPDYIKTINTDIITAVQNMALVNVISADLYKLLSDTIKNAMAWLAELTQPEWGWMGSDQTGWRYGDTNGYAKDMYVRIGKTWSYFGSQGYWEEPKDDKEEWDWYQKEGEGRRYGNFNKYFAHNTFVYITMEGTLQEYWMNEEGWYEADESGESEWSWHGSGTSEDPYWFGEEGATSEDPKKYAHDTWLFIDGAYYFFDSYGYYAPNTAILDYQWDWVQDDERWWFGNAIDREFAAVYVESQWLKINGTWYYFDEDGYVVDQDSSRSDAIAVFTTGMASLLTTVNTRKDALYTLLYALMTEWVNKKYSEGIDKPALTVTVSMADLSRTTEYANFVALETIKLGDSVEIDDTEHGIHTTGSRVIGLTYDVIRGYNSNVVIGKPQATVSSMLSQASGQAVAGGFDTSAIEAQIDALQDRVSDVRYNGRSLLQGTIAILDSIGGTSINYGTSTPTGGSDGDVYFQTDSNGNIVSIWQNHSGVWGGMTGGGKIDYGTYTPVGGADGDVYLQLEETGEPPFGFYASETLEVTQATDTSIKIEGVAGNDAEYVCYKLAGLTIGQEYVITFDAQLMQDVSYYSGSSYRYGAMFNDTFEYGGTVSDYVAFVRDTSNHSYTTRITPIGEEAYFWVQTGAIYNGQTIDLRLTNINITPYPEGTIDSAIIKDIWLNDNGMWINSDFSGGGNVTDVEIDGTSILDQEGVADITTMEGATSATDGTGGLAPKPLMGDEEKFLCGDGTWKTVEGGGGANLILDAQRYSLEEKVVGVWTDGKPLYQRTFEYSAGLNLNSSGVALPSVITSELTDVDKFVRAEGVRTTSGLTQAYIGMWVNSDRKVYTADPWSKVNIFTFWYTKTTDTAGSGGYQAYGFSPIVYSDVEREVGVWKDNKPLYQKTVIIQNNVAWSNNTTFDNTISDADTIWIYDGYIYDGRSTANVIQPNPIIQSTDRGGFTIDISNKTKFKFVSSATFSVNSSRYAVLTVRYTKTTDVAGSGEYNTLAIPNVHYSTDEQVIGTYMGETLYRKVIDEVNISTSSSWVNLANITSGKDLVDLKVWGYFSEYFLIAYSQAHIDSATGTLEVKFNVGDTRTIKRIAVDYTKTTD